jgi:hypothetical protein
MDQELLVNPRIEDGRALLAELLKVGFDVTVACWVKTSEEGLWFLYIGSTSGKPGKIGDAYVTAYDCLSRIPSASISLSEIKLVPATNPIARDALAIRERQPGRIPIRYHGTRLGKLAIEEAYIYPRLSGSMTPIEILQTVLALANGPAGSQSEPSLIRLQDGSEIRGVIIGFHLQLPGGPTLTIVDRDTKAERQISTDDVVNIQ